MKKIGFIEHHDENDCLDRAIYIIKRYFDVEFFDWERNGKGVLLSGGFGIGMALMDSIPSIKYFLDTDQYINNKEIDWESIMILLSCAKPDFFVFSGQSFKAQEIFKPFFKGIINIPVFKYIDNPKISLQSFIDLVNSNSK